jgi:hypothetical protein
MTVTSFLFFSWSYTLLLCGCRQLEEQQARQEEQEDKLHSQQLTGLNLAAQVTALEKARAADGEVLAVVPQHTTELEEVSGCMCWRRVARIWYRQNRCVELSATVTELVCVHHSLLMLNNKNTKRMLPCSSGAMFRLLSCRCVRSRLPSRPASQSLASRSGSCRHRWCTRPQLKVSTAQRMQ